MGSHRRIIAEIASSDMSRSALNAWDKFKLPPDDKRIKSLMKELGRANPTRSSRRH